MEATAAAKGGEEEGPREHIVSTNGASACVRVLHERLRAVLEANGRDVAVEALLGELEASGEDLQREYASAREETSKRLQDVRDHEKLASLQQVRLVEDWNRLRTENAQFLESNTALEARVKELETSERASSAQTKGLQVQMRLADGLLHDRARRIDELELKLAASAAENPAATRAEVKAAEDGKRELIDELGEDLMDDQMYENAGQSDDVILSLTEEAATLRKRLSEEEGRVRSLQETAARHEVLTPPWPASHKAI
jgi:pyruvate/2-oxoglutarate dehydrogenase complex dihydrolipoamide acyltransferase (E2) component